MISNAFDKQYTEKANSPTSLSPHTGLGQPAVVWVCLQLGESCGGCRCGCRAGSLHGMALCTEWLFARNDVYLFIYSDVCGPGQRLECQSTLTGLLTGLLTGPGADRPELLAAVCGSGLALSRAWGQRGSVTNSSFSFNPYNINTHTAYMRGGLCASSVLRA